MASSGTSPAASPGRIPWSRRASGSPAGRTVRRTGESSTAARRASQSSGASSARHRGRSPPGRAGRPARPGSRVAVSGGRAETCSASSTLSAVEGRARCASPTPRADGSPARSGCPAGPGERPGLVVQRDRARRRHDGPQLPEAHRPAGVLGGGGPVLPTGQVDDGQQLLGHGQQRVRRATGGWPAALAAAFCSSIAWRGRPGSRRAAAARRPAAARAAGSASAALRWVADTVGRWSRAGGRRPARARARGPRVSAGRRARPPAAWRRGPRRRSRGRASPSGAVARPRRPAFGTAHRPGARAWPSRRGRRSPALGCAVTASRQPRAHGRGRPPHRARHGARRAPRSAGSPSVALRVGLGDRDSEITSTPSRPGLELGPQHVADPPTGRDEVARHGAPRLAGPGGPPRPGAVGGLARELDVCVDETFDRSRYQGPRNPEEGPGRSRGAARDRRRSSSMGKRRRPAGGPLGGCGGHLVQEDRS